MLEESDVLDSREAARYLKLNQQTIRRLVRENQIPGFKVGGSWRFKKSVLDRWAESQQQAAQTRRVLVVDDEEPVREYVRRVLEREGYEVLSADDGEGAVNYVENGEPIDCVMLDLRMPGMGGPEALERIRNYKRDIPVVLLTGYPEIALMHRAMQSGPITLLAKPVSRAQILEAVENFLGRKK
ncbi:MAG: response regulator [Planctomycetes bacterium]|nr:response regulator [Planctomycetota bacterium]